MQIKGQNMHVLGCSLKIASMQLAKKLCSLWKNLAGCHRWLTSSQLNNSIQFNPISCYLSTLCWVAHKTFTELFLHPASCIFSFFLHCASPGGLWSPFPSFPLRCPGYRYIAVIVVFLPQYVSDRLPSSPPHFLACWLQYQLFPVALQY